jgi:hypothetical protein
MTFLRRHKMRLCYPEKSDATCFHISYIVMMAFIAC